MVDKKMATPVKKASAKKTSTPRRVTATKKGAVAEAAAPKSGLYAALIESIFANHYQRGAQEFEFNRTELEEKGKDLGFDGDAKNLGDVIYTYRYRRELPRSITKTAPPGREWIIEGAGRSKYRFRLATRNRIVANPNLITIKIPDATPEIIIAYAQSDEQALLAKVRYNRLIDIFLGISSYSLQNHLRTTLKAIGQLEIDEIYVGIDKHGSHYVIPVQAKGGNDKHAVVQTQQDIAYCKHKLPTLICRAVSAQFMTDGRIALFELTVEDGEVKVVEERHYELVPSSEISAADLQAYNQRSR